MTNDSKISDECYELAATLNEAVEVFYEPFDGHESTRIAAKILAAGYRKPRTITAVEELYALPTGTVIRADNAEVFEKQADGPYCDGPHDWQSMEGTFWNGETFAFPATILYEPAAECDGAPSCEAPTHSHGCFAEATR